MHYFILCMYSIFWTRIRCSGGGSACRGGDILMHQPLLHETREEMGVVDNNYYGNFNDNNIIIIIMDNVKQLLRYFPGIGMSERSD